MKNQETVSASSSDGAPELLTLEAGGIRLELSQTGQMIGLADTTLKVNYVHRSRPSHLATIRKYGGKHRCAPTRTAVTEKGPTLRVVDLEYEDGIRLTIQVRIHASHLALTLTHAQRAEEIESFYWGPFITTMTGPVAEYLGLCRSNDFSIGLISLEPTTDGSFGREHRFAARNLEEPMGGSCLELMTQDHARDGMGPGRIRIRGVAGKTVVGSAAAIFGCKPQEEMDVVEAIEIQEGLPHPMLDGRWVKRTDQAQRSSLWVTITQNSFDKYLSLAQQMGAGSLCAFTRMFANWGHFELDGSRWPGGLDAVAACAAKARREDVRVVMYTLTAFLKPINRPEPFLSPAPDPRLQVMLPETLLAAGMDREAKTVRLEDREGLLECLQTPFDCAAWIEDHDTSQFVRIGEELVYYRSARRKAGSLVLEDCRRGMFDTAVGDHPHGTPAVRMLLTGYRNFYPGTLDMCAEVAANVARVAHDGGFGQVTLDGHESCLETGHGPYAQNLFLRTIYDRCGDDIFYSGSTLGNYDWHMMSYISWGEWDRHKGFRGTMLDYRLMRQVQMKRNHMPRRMGQYYPDNATEEDIDWLMGLAAGWDAGVDFYLSISELNKNPHRDAIVRKVRLWEEARLAGAFSEAQKMRLRQTDCLHTLDRHANGAWNLRLVGRWRHGGLTVLPPSAMPVAPTSPAQNTVADCTIDFGWTHDPGIYRQAVLSNDLVHRGGPRETRWDVTYPGPEPRETIGSAQKLLFVLRVPPQARCGIRNPRITLDSGESVVVPIALRPGQYLSTTHDMPLVNVYDGNHNIISEVAIAGELPRIQRGASRRVGISCESEDPGDAPEVRLNLRMHHPIEGE